MANEANIKRIEEIKEQVKALGEEAQRLADEEGVAIDFSDTPFAHAYGAGDLRYTPTTPPTIHGGIRLKRITKANSVAGSRLALTIAN